MLVELLLAVVLGCMMGIITGITPGLHINLVALMLLSISAYLLDYINVVVVSAFIIAMSITHTFSDFISSVYLGAPSDDTALAVLPGHKLLLEGKAYEAVKLTVVGSLLCLILVVVLAPALVYAVPLVFSFLEPYIGLILAAVVAFMILKEAGLDRKFWAFLVFLLSGLLGLLAFQMPVNNILFPLLSGLFGISMLITSLAEQVRIPKQVVTDEIVLSKKDTGRALASGVFSGSLVSIFPGLGPAQAAILGSQLVGKITDYLYLVLVGGINTVSMVLALITMYTIEKARNGSIIVVQQLIGKVDVNVLIVFLAVALVAGGIATYLTLEVSKVFSRIMNYINYRVLSLSIIAFILSLVLYFSGFIGFFILLVSTAIGLIPGYVNIGRNHAMGVLLLPVIVYFLV
ncbi:tripartite tricarboxylate transporter permease [Candidatus Woesearchaeota archaeon]|nr:tripartite tricarboxylate transporter permease [Candidatus Woesearchaeota archaeon]